jgi:hypothetical protein
MKNERSRLSLIHKDRPLYKIISVALFGVLAGVQTFRLFAQAPVASTDLSNQLPVLKISYGTGKSLSIGPDYYADHWDFIPVAVHADQVLQVNLQFPSSFAGQSILVGAVEGAGLITTPTSAGAVVIANDGTVSVGYQAPHSSGNYRIAFRFGSRNTGLPVIVLDALQGQGTGNCPTTN